MYRQALRSTPRAACALRQSLARSAPRRFASTSPADKPRSWKSSALRWGLAGAAVYYYATSNTFAEEQSARTIPEPPHFSESDLKTVDAVIEEKRQKNIVKAKESAPEPLPAAAADAVAAEPTLIPEEAPNQPGSLADLEEEAGQQAAFNPETGEINWDCPCLGGMADGPCGEEFKAAFSCFVYSEEEPKGMDCIEKFQGMQECFRKYPEVYSSELADDEEAEAAAAANPAPAEGSPTETAPAVNADGDAIAAPEKVAPRASTEKKVSEEPAEAKTEEKKKPEIETKTTGSAPAPVHPEAATESAPSEVPTKAFDATEANKKDE